jgi:RHS repeat-associated protein
VIQADTADEFGVVTQAQGTSAQPFGYTREQQDAESCFVFLRARYYDPALGRFLSRDAAFGSIADPRSLHRYAYAANDPVVLRDPSGQRFCDGCDGVGGSGFAGTSPIGGAVAFGGAVAIGFAAVSAVLHDAYAWIPSEFHASRGIAARSPIASRAVTLTPSTSASSQRLRAWMTWLMPFGRPSNTAPRVRLERRTVPRCL